MVALLLLLFGMYWFPAWEPIELKPRRNTTYFILAVATGRLG